MRILYISPENTVGTLTLWKKEHESRGNECRTLTFFQSSKGYKEDICLNLPFNFTNSNMASIRNFLYQLYRGKEGYYKEKVGFPPIWTPEGIIDKYFLKIKDFIWKPLILKAIKEFRLYDFDVIHFESGMDFLKNEFFVRKLKEKGKKIICHYHGEDLRSRGVMPFINKVADLNLTNELDLLKKHPNIEYLFLPFETSVFSEKQLMNDKIRVAHAPTNRFYKGSDKIIKICKKLAQEGKIDFDLIEGVSNKIALERKQKSDIFIDQIGDKGGWGYGMNSIESLSMGICTLTEMNDAYKLFIKDHPFVNINNKTIEKVLRNLILNRKKIISYGSRGKDWVKNNHDISEVGDKLYFYYQSIGLSV
ncbi:MAG: hypothetical protein CMG55_01800 [Candidatus Marinimicrobia bacterium]|nr:hypothetical protein [Candidatus Neomarinimicrobiota bacterium]|tara:strand:+ start:20402 stop:21490 length:1089 start_codon:yes stop_codon:yes gene_type:complete